MKKGRAAQYDHAGDKFGMLTVVDRLPPSGGDVEWNCVCECGQRKVVTGSSLRSGNTRSCGCIKDGDDLTGKRFGGLTVTGIASRSNGIWWRAVCDCGRERVARGHAIKSGGCKSCNACALKGAPLKHDCAGKTFGRLTAIDRSVVNGQTMWRCKCSCGSGKEVWAAGFALVNGRHSSCGCLQKENVPRVDMAGQRFGMLVATSRAKNKNGKPGATQWNCVCDCGGGKVVLTAALCSGGVKSCGCRGNTYERAERIVKVLRESKKTEDAASQLGIGQGAMLEALKKHGLGKPSDYLRSKADTYELHGVEVDAADVAAITGLAESTAYNYLRRGMTPQEIIERKGARRH
jgi:hypothetical protein